MGSRNTGVAMRALFLWVLSLVASQAFAHGGGLNAEGCHNNRKMGDYHCHRAPVAPEPRQATREPRQPQGAAALPKPAPTRSGPECFVGPRGGTYTITASGRKNYGGC